MGGNRVKTKRKNLLVYLILVLGVCGVLMVVWNTLRVKQRLEAPVELSVIVRWQSSEEWENLRRGIELAARDYNIDVVYINLTQANDGQEQKNLIEREKGLSTQAILLSAADAQALSQTVSETKKSIPVICFESGVSGETGTICISADNQGMGQALGGLLLEQGTSTGTVLLLGGEVQCQSIQQRKAGVLDALEGTQLEVVELKEGQEIQWSAYDAVLALDAQHLEQAAQKLASSSKSQTLLYGIGGNNRIAYSMEHDIIQGIVAQNEVGMGYLGAKQAADVVRSGEVSQPSEIEYRVITKQTMYERENEQLLFPFGL